MPKPEKERVRRVGGQILRILFEPFHSGFFCSSSFKIRHFSCHFPFRSLPLCAALLALPSCPTPKTTAPPKLAMAEIFKPCRFKKTQSLELNYLLFLPQGYAANSGQRWPLLLFLHGAGERGSDIWKV